MTTGSADEEKNHQTPSEPVSQRRRALPQYLVALAKSFLLVDLGMVIAFPTLVIPSLLDSSEGLRFTPSQASWFGSIMYICQPLGSVTAAGAVDWLGRKRTMVFLNIPFFCCWVAPYFAQTATYLIVLSGIMGLTIGSIEASVLAYVGEISEPRLRGTLTSLSEIAVHVGLVFMYFLGTVTDWQTSALVSALVPVITCILLLQIPETPIWLLSKGRSEEAMKALCWLRGWASPDQVQREFDEIFRYSIASKATNINLPRHAYENEIDLSDEIHTNHQKHDRIISPDGVTKVNLNNTQNQVDSKDNLNSFKIGINGESIEPQNERKSLYKEKLKVFFRREVMLPMFLVCSFFFFVYGSGFFAMRPYMVPVVRHLGIEMEPFLATTMLNAFGLGGCVMCTVTVHIVGKRPLALASVLGCAISCLSLGTYALYMGNLDGHKHVWMPMVMMVALAFFTGIGVDPLPWMYLSEVFPFRGRGMACGVAAAISYVFGFIATKSFLFLEDKLTPAGVFFLFGGFGIVGFIYFYFYLPETEGKSMEEIEESFMKKGNKNTELQD